jgi:hypothetical protein
MSAAVGRVILMLAVALALAGCGGGERAATRAGSTADAAATTTVDKCNGSKSAAVRARKARLIQRDLVGLRRLAAPIQTRTLNGTPALSNAVDKFLLDVATRDLPVHVRSRYIDRAVAIVTAVCEQCFQALEAARPVGGGAKMGCG